MKIAEQYGVTGHELRDSFVQASSEFFAANINAREGRPATAARVAMYTGLNTAEVRERLTSRMSGASAYARRAQALSEILGAWHSDKGYAAVYDLAREIPFASTGAPDEDNCTFVALCEKYGGGIEPSSLLEDLMLSGCVEEIAGGYLRPKSRTYVLPPGELARLDRMGKVMSNFAETFRKILGPDADADFAYTERTLVADYQLGAKGARAFDSEFRNRGTKLLTDLDSWMTSQQLRIGVEQGGRYGCGIYFFEDLAAAGTTEVFLDEDEDAVSRERVSRKGNRSRDSAA